MIVLEYRLIKLSEIKTECLNLYSVFSRANNTRVVSKMKNFKLL